MQLTGWGVSYFLSTRLKYICELHNKNVSFTGSFSGGPVGGEILFRLVVQCGL